MSTNTTAVEELKNSLSQPMDDIKKSYVQSGSPTSGLTAYDLEPGAKLLFPVLTPLRNIIPRVVGGVGTQANWRAITAINVNNRGIGIPEGKRGAITQHTEVDYLAKYVSLGQEDSVTYEAQYAGRTFADVQATASKNLLLDTMIEEEKLDIHGNNSLALGTTPTPVLSTATTGGSLATATTFSVIAVALTETGYAQLVGLNNGSTGQTFNQASATLLATFSITTNAGETYTKAGGVARKSTSATVTTGGTATNTVSATVTPVIGAVAYAWFFGTAGNEVLHSVSTINSNVFTDTSVSTLNASTLPAADNSVDSLVYDGLLTQILKPNSGSYVRFLPTGTAGVGTALTSDGAGGINEIEDAFASFYNLYRLSPDKIIVSANVAKQIVKLIIANNGAPILRLFKDSDSQAGVSGGNNVNVYLNKYTQTNVEIMIHPMAAPGTIMFYSSQVPYSLGNIANIVEKKLRIDYYQIEWPARTRQYEFGVYFDGVLANYFPPAFGLIANIAA